MSSTFVLVVALVVAIATWTAALHLMRERHLRRQREIFQRGASCEGRVVAIQRPFMLESCTRFYFDFEPPGADRTLRVCHVDRRSGAEAAAIVPHTGAAVTIHYLPERPYLAVISKLV